MIKSFGSPVPRRVGVLSPVTLSVAGEVMIGTGGGTKSTTKVRKVGRLLLPAASRVMAESVCVPEPRGMDDIHAQWPDAFALVVQIGVVPSYTVTVLLASAFPVIVGSAVLITLFAAGKGMVGIAGA